MSSGRSIKNIKRAAVVTVPCTQAQVEVGHLATVTKELISRKPQITILSSIVSDIIPQHIMLEFQRKNTVTLLTMTAYAPTMQTERKSLALEN